MKALKFISTTNSMNEYLDLLVEILVLGFFLVLVCGFLGFVLVFFLGSVFVARTNLLLRQLCSSKISSLTLCFKMSNSAVDHIAGSLCS